MPGATRPRARGLCLVLLAAALGLATGGTRALAETEVRRTEGLIFATMPTAKGPQELRLDLYSLPAGGARPLFLYVHGGGFVGGARDEPRPLLPYLEALARAGYVVASIDYRLKGDAPVIGDRFQPMLSEVPAEDPRRTAYIASVEDTAAALDYLIANAGAHGIDPGRIAVGGGSAGAAAVLMLGYAADDLSSPPPPRPDVVVAFWGNLAGWIGLMDADDPPLMLVHGTDDPTVPIEASRQMLARAGEAGLPAELAEIEGGLHGFANIDLMTAEAEGRAVRVRILEFLDRHLNRPAG
ncbi:MAG: alpha/beta hydrolase [Alphaproteobacteria bacterium]|nr:alpha/beta hydrolase [Alphaproteobacteria bacterium]